MEELNDVIGLLEDILQEFGHKQEIQLQTERLQEMLDKLNAGKAKIMKWK